MTEIVDRAVERLRNHFDGMMAHLRPATARGIVQEAVDEATKELKAEVKRLLSHLWAVRPDEDGNGGETWEHFAADVDMGRLVAEGEVDRLKAEVERLTILVRRLEKMVGCTCKRSWPRAGHHQPEECVIAIVHTALDAAKAGKEAT